MRISEVVDQSLEEGWKEKAIGAAMLGATTAGILGPGIVKNMSAKHAADKPQTAISRHYIQRSPEANKKVDFGNNKAVPNTPSSNVPNIILPEPKKFDPAVVRAALEKAVANYNNTHARKIQGKELSMFMAQCSYETGHFTSLEEKGTVEYFFNHYDKDGANAAKAAKLGNIEPLDGIKYRGSGGIHITGRYNFKMVQDELNTWAKYKNHPLNLVDHPEILRTNPQVASDAAVAFWKLRVAPALKGKKATIATATRMVNPSGHGAMARIERFAQELFHSKHKKPSAKK